VRSNPAWVQGSSSKKLVTKQMNKSKCDLLIIVTIHMYIHMYNSVRLKASKIACTPVTHMHTRLTNVKMCMNVETVRILANVCAWISQTVENLLHTCYE
jgi:hypothetical protein